MGHRDGSRPPFLVRCNSRANMVFNLTLSALLLLLCVLLIIAHGPCIASHVCTKIILSIYSSIVWIVSTIHLSNCKCNISDVQTQEENSVPLQYHKICLKHQDNEDCQNSSQDDDTFHNTFIPQAMIGLKSSSSNVHSPWKAETNHDIECIGTKCIRYGLVSQSILSCDFLCHVVRQRWSEDGGNLWFL